MNNFPDTYRNDGDDFSEYLAHNDFYMKTISKGSFSWSCLGLRELYPAYATAGIASVNQVYKAPTAVIPTNQSEFFLGLEKNVKKRQALHRLKKQESANKINFLHQSRSPMMRPQSAPTPYATMEASPSKQKSPPRLFKGLPTYMKSLSRNEEEEILKIKEEEERNRRIQMYKKLNSLPLHERYILKQDDVEYVYDKN